MNRIKILISKAIEEILIKILENINFIAYLIAMSMGLLFSWFTIDSYIDNKEIKEHGVKVKVLLIDKEYRKNMVINIIEYHNKTYRWEKDYQKKGKGYEVGDSIDVLYSSQKDMFLKNDDNSDYLLLLFWLFLLVWGGGNILILVYRRYYKRKAKN